MKRFFYACLTLACLGAGLQACSELQSKEASLSANRDSAAPKLIVGIVVDQMRYEYLHRYNDKFSKGGFNRLLNEGYNLKNTHYNYVPTYTGPGHASVYTGTTPATHGIIANTWYDKRSKDWQYCVGDTTVNTVGSDSKKGQMSPRNMLASTISDELKFSGNKKSKVIGISLKDRGSILPAGHTADAAYWYDDTNGHFVSSTYYMDELPGWMQTFNDQNYADKYLSKPWETLLPIEQYVESGEDDQPYETPMKGKEKTVFPYDLPKLRETNGNFRLLWSTPGGNTIITDMAKAAIKGEKLGQDSDTDLLAVSFSTTDVVGHRYGLNSVELQDIYLRLDRDLEKFFAYLDKEVGKGQYMVFLTADHAAADVPKYMTEQRIPSGYIKMAEIQPLLEKRLNKIYGKGDWVENVSNGQVFLNRELINKRNIDATVMRQLAAEFLMDFDGITAAYTYDDMMRQEYNSGLRSKLQMGFHPKRSGDVILVYNPAWIDFMDYGTTHGSGYTYDTHVPLLWYGWGTPHGESVKYHTITDIAPTIAAKLNIKFPNASNGQPIEELFRN